MSYIEKRKVLVDTDVGLDDVHALIYLSSRSDIELLAVTLVPGVAGMDVITDNIQRVLRFLRNKTLPVFKAGEHNLFCEIIESDGHYGKNGLGDIELPKKKMNIRNDMMSSTAMIHYARMYPQQVHILCLGPLTNLALAFLIDNEFPKFVGSITIMGSDRAETSVLGVTYFAEFNTWCDPVAYQVVMNCFTKIRQPIRVVDWSFCIKNLFPLSLFDRIREAAGKIGCENVKTQLFHMLTDSTNAIIQKSYLIGGFLSPDLLAALALCNPELFNIERMKLHHVEPSGTKVGHTIYQPVRHCFVDLVKHTNIDALVDLLVKTIPYSTDPPKKFRKVD
ncbi:putative uridine nucleosidase 2 [Thelohanellus kitauei]|uniref:Putative uridine nucleosidase 2 n=1 Tax=Thelohanellus kitauei TaxID=669202 RepID=A0A0C2MXV7_THEKT|nr:putative uridine nucleosidase 2 [Thelohanellus kitauei]